MKLSKIRSCDNCGGKITPSFYLVRYSIAVFNQAAINEVLGMTQYFQGALGLAEAMAPRADVVTVAMDESKHSALMVELFICANCYAERICLAEIAERLAAQQAREPDAGGLAANQSESA
jgi:hypothetical protein